MPQSPYKKLQFLLAKELLFFATTDRLLDFFVILAFRVGAVFRTFSLTPIFSTSLMFWRGLWRVLLQWFSSFLAYPLSSSPFRLPT